MDQRMVVAPVGAAAFLMAVLALGALDGHRGEAAASGPQLFTAPLFKPDQIAALSGGFGPAISDIYWIRTISAGEEALHTEAGQWHFLNLLMGATAADPKFEPPYQTGAILLSVVADRPDLADLLCARAELNLPDSWEYPFYRGFFRLYHDLDFDAAALHLDRAAHKRDVPPYIKSLARRLRWRQHDPRTVLELIERLETVTNDPAIRARTLLRRNQIINQLRAEAGK